MYLDFKYRDALRELFNIGVGRAASELNMMIESPIELEVPDVTLATPEEVAAQWGVSGDTTISSVQLPFTGAYDGRAMLAFTSESASLLVALLTGEEGDAVALDSLRAGTLTEVGNILLNSVMGSIANVLVGELHYRVPTYAEERADTVLGSGHDQNYSILVAKTRFTVRSLNIEGDINVAFKVGSFEEIISAIDAIDAA